MNGRRWPVIAVLAAALAGCGGAPRGMWAYDRSARLDGDYEEALATWTRSAETYEFFESRVFVHATYFSPRFAAAYAQRRAERLALSPADARAELEERVSRAEREAAFLLSVFTHDPAWNDFAGLDDPGGTLRVVLVDGDRQIAPTRLEPVSTDEQADLFPFFPYVGPLATAYWVTFPQPADPRAVTLRIAGPPAVVDLHWSSR